MERFCVVVAVTAIVGATAYLWVGLYFGWW
jgi:hypothetical protein